MTAVVPLTIMVDEDLAAALQGETLCPDEIALAGVIGHAVLMISHELGDIAEGPRELQADDLRRLAARLDRIATAVEVMRIDDRQQHREGGE